MVTDGGPPAQCRIRRVSGDAKPFSRDHRIGSGLWGHVAWLGDMPPSPGVPTSGHVATCPYGMIRNVAAGRRCIVGGCGIVVARGVVRGIWHRGRVFRCGGTLQRAPTKPPGDSVVGAYATVGGCSDVWGRSDVWAPCNVPLRDNSQCCRRATLHCRGMSNCCGTWRGGGHLAPWADVPT